MTRLALALTLIVGLVVTSCAAPRPELTREEYLALVSRTYEGRALEDIITAAERVLRLADTDFKIRHFEDGFEAARFWVIYAVLSGAMGTDTWTVSTKPNADGTKTTVRVERSAGAGIVPIQRGAYRMESRALYDLFWARLDWMLGVRMDWMTCEESDRRIAQGFVAGENDALCSITTENRAPADADRVLAR